MESNSSNSISLEKWYAQKLCRFCRKVFETNWRLKRHEKSCGVCRKCKISFESQEQKVTHRQPCTKYICEICKRVYKNKKLLSRHRRIKHTVLSSDKRRPAQKEPNDVDIWSTSQLDCSTVKTLQHKPPMLESNSECSKTQISELLRIESVSSMAANSHKAETPHQEDAIACGNSEVFPVESPSLTYQNVNSGYLTDVSNASNENVRCRKRKISEDSSTRIVKWYLQKLKIMQKKAEKDDPTGWFFKFIACEARAMPTGTKMKFQMEVMKLLAQYTQELELVDCD